LVKLIQASGIAVRFLKDHYKYSSAPRTEEGWWTAKAGLE